MKRFMNDLSDAFNYSNRLSVSSEMREIELDIGSDVLRVICNRIVSALYESMVLNDPFEIEYEQTYVWLQPLSKLIEKKIKFYTLLTKFDNYFGFFQGLSNGEKDEIYNFVNQNYVANPTR